MQDHEAIRQRAYEIWEKAGKPEGAHHEHWGQAAGELQAEAEIATLPGSEPSDGNIAGIQKQPSGSVLTSPNNGTRGAKQA